MQLTFFLLLSSNKWVEQTSLQRLFPIPAKCPRFYRCVIRNRVYIHGAILWSHAMLTISLRWCALVFPDFGLILGFWLFSNSSLFLFLHRVIVSPVALVPVYFYFCWCRVLYACCYIACINDGWAKCDSQLMLINFCGSMQGQYRPWYRRNIVLTRFHRTAKLRHFIRTSNYLIIC